MIERLDGFYWEVVTKLNGIEEQLLSPDTTEVDKHIAVKITASNQIVADYVNSITTAKESLASNIK